MAVHPDDRGACDLLIADLQSLESRAHRLGLTVTAHGINHVKNAAGWEFHR